MKYKISVVLATFNGERYLKSQLNSIINQRLLPYEIIIIDDCSTDNTLNTISNFNFFEIKVKIIKNGINLGPIANFKKGISLAKGDFIALCDQDDIWLPSKLEVSLENILKLNQNKACAVYSDLTLIDEDNNLMAQSLHKLWNINPEKFDFFLLLNSNVVTGCTLMFNKEMQFLIKKMPINILMHDYWIGLIGYSLGEIKYINDSTILYRHHSGSYTSKIPRSFIGQFKSSEITIYNQQSQINKFESIYREYLCEEDKKTISKYIKMSKYNYIIQKIIIKLWKLSIKIV